MATVTLVDFSDLYTAVCEELKIQLTDGTTVARIKRDINMIYLSHVVPFKPRAWWWLEKTQDIQTHAKVTGTVTITDGSTSITLGTAPSVSLAGYRFKVQGFEEVIEITAHTAATTSATLKSAWRRGNVSAVSYTAWKDYTSLDSDMKEVVMVTHEKLHEPVVSVSSTTFREMYTRMPDYNGYPKIYTTGDFDGSANRTLKWYPACDTTQHTLHVLGVQEATRLSADADEPLMPVEDRIVLFYGACSRAWARERNESEAGKNWQLFQQKLAQMAAKSEDAPKVTEMSVDSDWLVNKRYRRLARSRRSGHWRRD